METIVFLPGYLSPPAGFSAFREAFPAYRLLEAEPHPTPAQAEKAWRGRVPEGAHLVAFSEACVAAVRIAPEVGAKSLVLFSPYFRVDDALLARLRALREAYARGGHSAFVTAAAPWFFGSLLLGRGQAQIEAWAKGLEGRDLEAWLEGLLSLGDVRKWLRRLEQPTLVAVGAEDVFTPMRYGHEVTEWVPELRGMLVTIEGAGHFAPWENPAEAGALARGFVERYEDFLKGPVHWREEEEDAGGKPLLRFEPEAPS